MPESTPPPTVTPESAPAPANGSNGTPAPAPAGVDRQAVSDIDKLFDAPDGYQSPDRKPADKPDEKPAEVVSRQYADQEEEAIFSKMANESYNKVYPIWKQVKSGEFIPKTELEKLRGELTQSKQSRWYDHPKGYTLSDEYQTAADDNDLYKDIVQHYQQALVALDGNRPFYRVVPDKEQKYVIDQRNPIPPSPQAKAYITTELARFLNMQSHAENKVKDLETNYAPRFQAVKDALSGVDKDIFGPFEAKPGFQQAWQQELQAFPAELRSMPEYILIAKSSVLVKAMQNMSRKNHQASMQNATQPNNVGGGQVDATKNAIAKLDEIASRR